MSEKISYKAFSASIKAKYPEYSEVDDLELSTKMIEKYPEYADRVTLTDNSDFMPGGKMSLVPPSPSTPSAPLRDQTNFLSSKAGDNASAPSASLRDQITEGDKMRLGSFPVQAPTLNLEDKPAGQFYKPLPRQTSLYNPRLRENDMTGLTEEKTADARPALQKEFIAPTGESIKQGYGAQEAATAQSTEYLANPQAQAQAQWELLNSTPQKYGTPRKDQFGNESWDLTAEDQEYMNSLFDQLPERQQVEEWKKNPEKWNDRPFIQQFRTVADSQKSIFGDNWLGDASLAAGNVVEALNAGGAAVGGGLSEFVHQNIEKPLFGWVSKDPSSRLAFGRLADVFFEDQAYSSSAAGKHNTIDENGNIRQKDFTDYIKEGDFASALGDLSIGALESAPTSAVAIGATIAGSPQVGLSVIGAQVAGSRKRELDAMNPELSEFQKNLIAYGSGAIEAGSEMLGDIPIGKMLGKLYKTGGTTVAENVMRNSVDGIIKATTKQLKNGSLLWKAPLMEGGEEFVSGVGNYLLDSANGLQQFNMSEMIGQSAKQMAYGAVAGGGFGLVGTPGLIRNAKVAKELETLKSQYDTANSNMQNVFADSEFEFEGEKIITLPLAQQEEILPAVYEAENLSDAQKTAIRDYMEAGNNLNAALVNVGLTNIELLRKKANAFKEVQESINDKTGRVDVITIQGTADTQQYNVKSGTVALDNEGKVDTQNSDEAIYYYTGAMNEDGTPEVSIITPESISELTQLDPKEELKSRFTEIEAEEFVRSEFGAGMQIQVNSDAGLLPATVVAVTPTGLIANVQGQEVELSFAQAVEDVSPSTSLRDQENMPATEGEQATTYAPGTSVEVNGTTFVVGEKDEAGNYLINDENGQQLDRFTPDEMAEFGFRSVAVRPTQAEQVVSGDMTENAPVTAESAPVQYPLNKKGEIDFDAMTVAQTYEYMVDNYGQEEANNGLSMQEKSIQALISQNIKALSKVNEQLYGQLRTAKTYQEQLKIREKNKATITKLTDERTALDTQLAEIRALMPVVQQTPAQPEVMAVKGSNVRPEEQLRREQEAKLRQVQQTPATEKTEDNVDAVDNIAETVVSEQQPVVEVREKEEWKGTPQWTRRLINLGDAMTVEDVVLRRIAGGAKFVWTASAPLKGLAEELGFTNKPGERKLRKNLIDNENGMTPQEFAHVIYESGDLDFMPGVEYQDVYNAVVETLLQVNSATMAMEKAEANRNKYDMMQEDYDIYRSIIPEEWAYLEEIPDEILAGYLGITNFSPEQIDFIFNLQNEYYANEQQQTTVNAQPADTSTSERSEAPESNETAGQQTELTQAELDTQELDAEYKETPEAVEKVDSNVDTPEAIKTKLLSELTLPKYVYDLFNSLKQSESSDYIFAVYGKGFAPFNGRKINEFFSYVRNAINNNDKTAKEILQDKGFDISNVEKVDYTRIWFKNGIFLSKTTGETNSNANYFYAGTQVNIRDTKEYREISDQSVDVNEMIEKPAEATSAPKYKNGDTVYYQGKQYVINGIYNGVLAYDLETADGKPAFDEVDESKLSNQAPAPRSILDVAVEQVKKNEEKAKVKNEIPVSEDGLYQIREVKVKKNDGSIVTMFAVPTANSKGFGDKFNDLFDTIEEAIVGAKENRAEQQRDEERDIQYAEEKRLAEEAKAAKAKANEGKTSKQLMDEARENSVLDKKLNYDGVIMTRRQFIEKSIANGATLQTEQVNVIKDVSRTTWNRMNGREQDDFERRQKEAGKKTEYQIKSEEGYYYTITKIEYDYAQKLLKQSDNSKPTEESKPTTDKVSAAQAEADAALQDFLDAFNDLNSDNLGIVDNTAEKQAKMLVAGTKMVGAYTKLGVYKFADLVQQLQAKGIQITEDLLSAIKKAYGAFAAENDIDELDDMKTVRQFTLNNLQQKKNEDLTPKTDNLPKNDVSLTDQKFIKEHIIFGTIPKTNDNGQPRSTEIIESEAAVSETTSAAITNSASNVGSDKQRAGEVKEQATEQIKSVESLLAEVDNKLANLRLTDKSYSTDGIGADYPINVLAKGEIKKDLTKYIKAVAEITGLAHDTDKKGKTEIVNVNIAPAGGDATFFLWSKTNPEYGVYVSIPYDPDMNSGGWYDNYKVLNEGWRAHILYRVVNKAKKYDGSNQYMPTNVTAQEMAETLLKGINAELKSKGLAEEQVQEIQPAKAETKIKKSTQLPKNNSQSNLLSLFEDEEITPTQNEPERGNQETNSGLGSQKPQEPTGLQPTGVDRSSTTDNGVDGGRSSGISDIPATEGTRNTRNNVIPRGKEYAPSSPKARFDANIEAIKIVRRLIDSGKPATKADQQTLRQFSGWGGLGTYFNNQYSTENKTLREVLTPEEYESAVMSINSAYYTPAVINNALWDVAEKLGFTGGNVLEGSAGIGNIIGSMPRSMSSNTNIEAVEIDEISGNILKYLYPDAKVHIKGFEETNIPNGSVDLAITNVPFVTGLHVYDPIDKDLSKKFKNIHDFCIAKNIRKLKEGGIGIFITSNGTLDKSRELREWIGTTGKTDVIGAFRLNNDTFGGTNVTSDIIIVRKRVANQKHPKAIDVVKSSFVRSGEYATKDQVWDKKARTYVAVKKQTNMEYNDYFKEHPENMGGEMAFAYEKGDTFRPGGVGLYPGKVNQAKQLKQWLETFENIGIEKGESQKQEVAESTEAKEGQLILNAQGQLSLSYRGTAKVLDINSNKVKGETKAQCLKDYNTIKETLQAVLDYQVANESNDGLKPLLNAFNRAYDNFVAKYGQLNKNTTISFLRNDVDFPSIVSIEKYSETKSIDGKVTKNISKTAVFKDRVVSVKTELKPTNTKDAVIASIYTYGAINLPYIAESQNKTEQEIATEIISSKLGFKDPATGSVVVRHEYLSGDVRSKLKLAQASNDKSEYTNNIEELQKVIPMDIPAHLIEFTMGTSWLDKQLYVDYFKEKYNVDATVQHNEGRWIVVPSNRQNETNRAAGVYSEMLGITVYGSDLATAAMNLKPITISEQKKDRFTGKTETITDKDATQAANTRVSEIRDDFKEFVRGKLTENKEQADKMAQEYNDRANSYVPMEIDDTYLPERFEGSTEAINLHAHQKKATIRGTMEPLMLAHEVGAGKTFVLISTAMEMRRLGTANKPMIVVQNATVGQFVSSAKTLYPNAKILTITENDRTPEGRRMFYAKIKYSDWDMIVVPQSTFEMIPDSPEMQKRFIEEKIDEKLHALEALKEENDNANQWTILAMEKEIDELNAELHLILNSGTTDNSKSDNKEAKKTAKTITNTIARVKEQLDRRTDDVQYFDQMGIDALLVDEAHEYKRLGFATSMTRGVKGIDPAGSKKSAGVYLKTRVVLEKSDWKNVVFATGTPISNTAAEIWTFMKYLIPKETLIENEIYYFDDFVRNFGSINQSLEFATNGSYKENTRFSSYINKPELIRLWATVTDTVLSKDIDAVNEKIPLIEGDKATDIFLPQTPSLIDIMRAVKAELKRFEDMSGKEKKANSSIPIVMYGIAKRAAIDTRLVSKIADDEPNSKTNKAVEETLRSLKDSSKYKGTIAIFCDAQNRWDKDEAGKKVKGFDLFEDIKAKLIAKGVAESEIMIIKPGMTVARKEKIFDAVNAGEIRVVLGNTKTLGTGVNMQERLHTLIHMDAPDRPMDYTQRNGRILRQGNLHKEWGIPVRILRFGVEDSLDVTSYQRLKTKSGFIDSIMDGKLALIDPTNPEGRILEEDEEGLFDNPVAVLSGSQYALLKNQAERELRKWESKKKQHEADQIYIQYQVKQNEQFIEWRTEYLKDLEKAKAVIEAKFANGINTITIAGKAVNGVENYVTDDKIRAKVNEAIKPIAKAINEKTESARENAYFTKEKVFTKLKFNGVEATITTDIERESQWDEKIRMNRIVMHKINRLSIPELGIDYNLGGKSMMQVIEAVYESINLSKINDGIKYAESDIAQYRSDNAAMEARRGKPFAHGEELQAAKAKVVELTELMKQELAAKEEKYKNAGSGNKVDIADVESEEEETDGDAAPQFQAISPIGFYSTVEKALEAIQQEKGSKDQFKAMLLKNGAKQAEMDWMGFDELPEKLTKADIQNWIDENRIEVKEVEKGENVPLQGIHKKRQDLVDEAAQLGYKFEWFSTRQLSPTISKDGEELVYPELPDKIRELAEKSAEYTNAVNTQTPITETKFSQYVLPGGENYRELLLTMPEKETFDTYREKLSKKYGELSSRKDYTKEENEKLDSLFKNSNTQFKSSHFNEPNILAHIRFDERTVNGERVLFIEEFQSDWAQKGKKEGFKGDATYEPILEKENVWNVGGVKVLYFERGIDGKNYRTINEKSEQVWFKDFSDAVKEANNTVKNVSEKEIFKVPNMPFRKTDQWVNLAVRRMMRYAAENGFDRIAWTNGEQQADRYDLSKSIKEIEYSINPFVVSQKDNLPMYKLKARDKNDNPVIRGEYAENELENIVGKELAKKIINGEGKETVDKTKSLTGLDLKVGGEGMKAFYDAIVPSAMSKLGKPFGAKVESLELSQPRGERSDYEDLGAWEDAYEGTTSTQQSIPVTDSMKETAMAGLPLYHTGTTMQRTSKKEVSAMVAQLLKTGLAKEVRMVTPEEIAEMLDGAETLLRTPTGTIYGFVKGGIVYLNSSTPNLNTPIHEFGHLWVDAIEGSELYNRGAELVKGTPYWERVNADPNYKDLSEAARTKEAMAQAIGDKGEAVKRNLGLFASIKVWIADVWTRIGAKFGIQNITPEQIQNLTFNDFVDVAVSELLTPSPSGIPLKKGKAGAMPATIDVDGVQRPTTNSTGKPIHSTEEGIRNFWRWFGDSKVVDAEGRPLVVYHGTNRNFFEFKEDVGNRHDKGFYGKGFYFTFNTQPGWDKLAKEEARYYGENIIEAYVKSNNPFNFSSLTEFKGVDIGNLGQDGIALLYNVALNFPEIAQNIKIRAYDGEMLEDYSHNTKEIPISELPKLIDKYYSELKTFIINDDYRNEIYYSGYVKSEIVKLNNGESYESSEDLGRYYAKKDANGNIKPIDDEIKFGLICEALEKYYGISSEFHPEGYMTRNPEITDAIKAKGHDSIMQSEAGDELVVFSPTQIKSATGNNGGFDGSDPDIRYQVGPEKPEFTGDLGKFAQETTEYNEAQAERTTRISKMQRLQEIMVAKSALAARHRNKEVSNQEYAKQMTALHEEKQRVMKGLPTSTSSVTDASTSSTTEIDDPKPVRAIGQSIAEYATQVADWNYRQTIARALAKTASSVTGGLPPVDDDTDISGDMLRFELDQRLGGFFGRLVEGWQDNIRSVRIFQDMLKEKGTRISDFNNFHMQYTAIQGKNDAHLKDFGKRFMEAINANVLNIQKYTNYEYRDLENYLFLKHGIERNEYMRQAAAEEAVNEKLPKLTQEQIDGDIDGSLQDEYKAAYDQFLEEETAKVADKDYSGLFAVAAEIWAKQNGERFNPKKKGDVARIQKMDEFKADRDAVIVEYIAKFEKTISETIIPTAVKGEELTINGFWAAINAATHYSLDRLVSSGIESKEEVDDLKARYQYYVPLRGHEVEAEKIWQYEAPDNKNVVSKAIMQASGRGSRAEHPFAYIIQMAQTSINKANRNQLNQTILRLARLDKSGLMSVSETWYVLTGTDPDTGKEIWTETEPDFSEDHEIRAGEIRAWNEKMKKLEEEGKARRFKKGLRIGGLFIKPKQKRQHAITIFEDGVAYQVYINGNPRVSQAINELNGTKWNIPIITQTTRFISSMITSRSPQFMLTNGARDLAFASSILPSKEGARYTGQFLKNYPVAMAILANDATFDFGNDKAKYKKYLKEFEMNGGETGYSHLLELQDIQKELYKKQKGKNYLNPLTDLDAIISVVDAGNKVIENSTRLSVYISSRESGRSIERSVSDSKEVTLNFNRRGSGIMGAAHVSSIFMFVNAGVQALANFGHVYKMHPAKMSATIGAYAAVGFIMPMIISMIGGDDDEKEYMNMTDWERQTNLCLPTGSGFAKIPLPQEMRVFFKLGDEVYKLYSGRTEASETAMATLLSAADMIPISPLGTIAAGEIGDFGDLQRAISPDALRGVAELATNTNFMGGQIYDKYKAEKEGLPGYKKARVNRVGDPRAPETMVGFTQWLDKFTGGNGVQKGAVSLNPDVVNHLAKSYLGGMYSLIAEGEKSFTKRFYTSNADIEEKNTTVKDYYKRIREADEVIRQEKGYWDKVDKGEMSEDAYNKAIPPALLEKAYTIHDYGNTITKIERLLKTGDLTPDDELYYKHMSDSLKMEVIRIR